MLLELYKQALLKLLSERPKWEENIIKIIKSSVPTRLYSSECQIVLSYGAFKIHLERDEWAGWSIRILGHPEMYLSNRTKKIILSHLVDNGYAFRQLSFKYILQWVAIGGVLILFSIHG